MPVIRACPTCGTKNRIPSAHLTDEGRCGSCKNPLPPVDTPLEAEATLFDEILSSVRVPVLVDFWAAWCGPCRRAAPEVERAARELAGQAVVLKVDTERSPDLAARYRIASIPNFAVFRDGQLVMQQAGLVSHAQLVQWARAATQLRRLMHVRSVNVSMGRTIEYGGQQMETGIFKQPVTTPVRVRRLGLEGDRQADLVNHGGEDKAVYAYAWEHYDWWTQKLRRDDLVPGTFGENLTLEGLDERDVTPGDVFRIGDVLLLVNQPRQPCFKLGVKMGDMRIVERFLVSGRYGVYFRVMQEGTLRVGDAVECVTRVAPRFPLPDLLRLRYDADRDLDDVRRALTVPTLSPKWRGLLEGILAES